MSDDGRRVSGALSGYRVLDLGDELAAYASRLLGDLGADVIRVEPPVGSRTRRLGPTVPGAQGPGVSAFDRFVNAGKRSVTLDLDHPDGRALLGRLVTTADVLIETFSQAVADRRDLGPASLAALNPRLVHVSVTALGRDRTPENVDDDDLTIMASGGLLHLGGYPDSPPTVAYGGQGRVAASIFAAVATLVALFDRERTGIGRWIDVSAQECVAQALEDTVATFELTGRVRQRLGSGPREAGSGVYACADGSVSMVAGRVGTSRAWTALVAWLGEEGAAGAAELEDARWSELSFRQTDAAIARFGEIFGGFARSRLRLDLYRAAQRRGIALAPVNDVAAVLADPQLASRDFWVKVPDAELGRDATFPGPPFRLSATPVRPAQPAPALGSDDRAVLADELGLSLAQLEELHEAWVS
ncbi:MAG: CaiB/BaiF CoA transferase family protein [Candidatus Limnocylindrales bacterium]